MTFIHRIQDGVHGLMEFHDMETMVVDVLRAKELQRLRRIRQLGLAHFVFPGAEHSRLVHSIGASHLAIRFARQLRESAFTFLVDELSPNQSVIRDFALAGLCHDLGHGPLSHAWEREVIGNYDRRQWCEWLHLPYETDFARLKWHELVTQALLNAPEGELHALLETHETGTSERVRKILLGSYYIPYLPALLHSDIDADRSDFILRDAHETGVHYGRYDLNWLVSTLCIGRHGKELVAGFDERKAIRVVEQFLIARRALYQMVYYHKTVRSAEATIGLLLRRLKTVVERNDRVMGPSIFDVYKKVLTGQPVGYNDVVQLDDYSLWVLVGYLADTDADATLADLARRLVQRDLFKMVPCDEEAVSAFFERDDAVERLNAAVRPHVPDPAYYWYHDRPRLQVLSEKDDCSYFVDLDHPERKATLVREHEQFRLHWTHARVVDRLFVVGPAVETVRKLVES